jgi:DNA-binding CsgD family transcriptional regulator
VFPTFSELYKELPDGLACFLTNQYLINLYTIAKNPTRFQCRYQGLIPGTVFHERSAGTNAISMCNKLKRPVFLLGSQHYLIEMFSNKWFIADRVCLPNGEPLWIFALSAPLDKDPRMLIFLVQMLIKRLEHMVRRTWFTKQIVAELQKKASSFTLKPLTQRELEILSHLVDGKSYKEIANTLFLSLGTVNTYVYHIYSKLNVSSRKELRHKLSVNIPDMSF